MHPDRSSKLGGMARSDTAALATVIAVVGAVYAATLLPGITYWGEISKWQLLGRVLGIPHPTGYPLYLPLTHVVSLLSLGSLAWRINAFSLVCALVAVVALYRILRELDQPPWYAACFGMAFAFSRTLWSQAVIAEVYTLNAALVGWVVFYYLRWSRTRAKSDLLIASAIYALSFCHHLTVVCLLPAVVLLVVVTDPKAFIRLRVVVPVAAFIALGVSLYGYLFWRSSVGGPHLEYRVETLDDLWTYVSGAQYRGNMFSASPGDYFGKRLPAFVAVILREFQVVGLLAPVGLFVQRSARTGMFLGVALLGYTAFVSNYAISDAVPVNDVFFTVRGRGIPGGGPAVQQLQPQRHERTHRFPAADRRASRSRRLERGDRDGRLGRRLRLLRGAPLLSPHRRALPGARHFRHRVSPSRPDHRVPGRPRADAGRHDGPDGPPGPARIHPFAAYRCRMRTCRTRAAARPVQASRDRAIGESSDLAEEEYAELRIDVR